MATPWLSLRRRRRRRNGGTGRATAAGRKSLDHLFMRSEMIPEVYTYIPCYEGTLSVYVAFGLKRPTVCQWGRDLGLRPRLENMPRQRWPRSYFLTSHHRFSFRFAYLSDSLQSFPAFQISLSPFSFFSLFSSFFFFVIARVKGMLQRESREFCLSILESCG